jgi:hypothetical protein
LLRGFLSFLAFGEPSFYVMKGSYSIPFDNGWGIFLFRLSLPIFDSECFDRICSSLPHEAIEVGFSLFFSEMYLFFRP